MSTFAPQIDAPVKQGTVQRKCGCSTPGPCSCHEHDKEGTGQKGTIQRRTRPGAPTPPAPKAAIKPSVTRGIQQAATGGQSLPAGVKSQMEAGFSGRDLSQVRVHTDPAAAQLADSLQAQAFTTGSHIFFARDQYRPDTPDGQSLLAHELTHVIQQGSAAPGAIQPSLELGAVDTPAEREADRAADAVMKGLSASPQVPSPRSGVQRTARPGIAGGGERAIPVKEPLEVPAKKAESDSDLKYVLGLYETAAANGHLNTRHPRRAGDLWTKWAAGRQSPDLDLGSFSEIGEFQKKLHSKCSPDHIQELQVQGSDDPNNLRLLDSGRNSEAGSKLAGQISSLKNAYGAGGNDYLVFSKVKAKPGTSPAPDETCLAVEPLKKPGGAVTIAKGLTPLVFRAGGAPVRIGHEKDGEVQFSHRFAVACAELCRVVLPPHTEDGSHTIHAMVSSRIKKFPLKGKDRNFDFRTSGPQPGKKGKSGSWPELRLVNANPFSLSFPKMSPATLTPSIEDGQWRAVGELLPSLPVLSKARVHLEVGNDSLSGGVKFDAATLKAALPVPGLNIGNVSLEIAINDGDFSATGGFDFQYGKLARGSLTAGFSKDDEFHATGKLELLIPGITAEGTVSIEKGELKGSLHAGAEKIKFPGVKKGEGGLSIMVAGGVLTGSGQLGLDIPGLKKTSLTFTADSTGQFQLTGTAHGDIPGLKDVEATISYAGGVLTGTGHAGLKIPGLEDASINIAYFNGLLSGSASLSYKRGRLSGSVQAALSPEHKLSGKGQLEYEIVPAKTGGKRLVANAGIELREDGTAKVDASLTLPNPYIFFDKIGVDHPFKIPSIPDIPIFGISAGPVSVGLVAKVKVSLDAFASIGPGEIKGGIVLAQFDPNKEDGAFSFQAVGTVYVPAAAGLTLVIGGALSLDALVVDVEGEVDLNATAQLRGALTVPVVLQYRDGKFSVDAVGIVNVSPHFTFGLTATVRVYTDLVVGSITWYEKDPPWRLANLSWDPNFNIGLIFPVHYVFGEPFNISTDQISFIYPDINFESLMKSGLPKDS